MTVLGEQGMNQAIDPPLSATGFHREKEEIQISGQQNEKTATDGDLTPDNSQRDNIKNDDLPTGCTRFFKLKYYKQYFDICELEVITRLRASVTLPPNEDFIQNIGSKPDFYGPFWIMTTIITLLGFVGNLSNYLLSKFSDDAVWNKYFFDLALFRYAFMFVYVYGFGISAAIYFTCKVFNNRLKLELPDIICLYGYSLSSFIPAILGCVLPFSLLQWMLVIVAFAVSSFFLMKNIKNHCQRVSPIILLGTIMGIQIVFSLTVKLEFISLLT